MLIYLPIADMSVNLFSLLGLGAFVGLVSGMFGVGGGFLITPLLIFMGVPPAVAVASAGNQVVGASFSGFLSHWRRKSVDMRMGGVLLVGGMAGSFLGVQIFSYLSRIGQTDLFVSLCYVFFLGAIGSLMLWESINTLIRERRGLPQPIRKRHNSMSHLPGRVRFRQSNLYISIFPPFLIGFLIGILTAMMGIGGGFILVPAMIYLLAVPTSVVVGTSLFQIIFVAALTTMLHAVENQTVDAVLAILLLIGGVIGAQIGARIGAKLKATEMRVLLALLVLAVCGKLAFDLVTTPVEPFVIKEL